MHVQPYLMFEGRCEEALTFYSKAIGAKIEMLMRFKDNPEPEHNPPGSDEKIMHSELRIGESVVMATDGMCGEANPGFKGFSLSILAADIAESKRLFAALSEGGQVTMPLSKTFWSPSFGMLVDRFGVSWMINVMP